MRKFSWAGVLGGVVTITPNAGQDEMWLSHRICQSTTQNIHFVAFFSPDFLWVLWHFCITCFDHIHPFASSSWTHPFPYTPTFLPFCFKTWCIQFVLFLDVWTFHWSVVSLPEATLLKKTDTPSPSIVSCAQPSLTFLSPDLSNDSLLVQQGRRWGAEVSRGYLWPTDQCSGLRCDWQSLHTESTSVDLF